MPYKSGKKWKAQVRKEGLRQEKTFDTKKEAIDWETKMRKKPADEWVEKTNTVCLNDWAQQYLDYAEAKFSEKTYKEKQTMFKLFFKQVDPELPVAELTPKKVMGYVLEQRKQRSGYAANKDRKNLVAAWHWGMKYMEPPLPSPNPCKVDKMPEVRHPRYVPTFEDFLKVLEVAEGQDRIMLLCLYHLGARRGEIFRLRWNDVDFKNDRIRLATSKRQNGDLEYDWIPMNVELNEELKDLYQRSSSEFLFINPKTGLPFAERKRWMRALCKKAGVKPFGTHAIRHLASTILDDRNVRIGQIQKILRHRRRTTTEGYIHQLRDLKSAVAHLCFKN
ncbi:MAG: tyrosine-type recombinase/integrase [Desulfobacterales bacterium]